MDGKAEIGENGFDMIRAIAKDDIERAQAIIGNGNLDVNLLVKGVSLVQLAVIHDRPAILQLLMQHGAKLDRSLDKNGCNAFLLAANLNRAECVARMLKCPEGVQLLESKQGDGSTALLIASQLEEKENHEVVRMLLGAGANLEAKDADAWTPLMQAIFGGNAETLRILLNAGADLTAKGRWVGEKGKPSVTVLHLAAVRASVDKLTILLEVAKEKGKLGKLINAVDRNGNTAAHYAAWAEGSDSGPCVGVLTKFGAKPVKERGEPGLAKYAENYMKVLPLRVDVEFVDAAQTLEAFEYAYPKKANSASVGDMLMVDGFMKEMIDEHWCSKV